MNATEKAMLIGRGSCRLTLHRLRTSHRDNAFNGIVAYWQSANHFYRTSSYASALLAVVILSVRPSHACFVTKPNNLSAYCGYFDTARKGNHSSFLTPTVVGGWQSIRLKFALKVAPLRNTSTSTNFRLTSQLKEIAKKFNHDEEEIDHRLSNEL